MVPSLQLSNVGFLNIYNILPYLIVQRPRCTESTAKEEKDQPRSEPTLTLVPLIETP